VAAHENFSVTLVLPTAAPLSQSCSYWSSLGSEPAAVQTNIIENTVLTTISPKQFPENASKSFIALFGVNYIMIITALAFGLHGFFPFHQTDLNKGSLRVLEENITKPLRSIDTQLSHPRHLFWPPSHPLSRPSHLLKSSSTNCQRNKRPSQLTDQELVLMTVRGKIPGHALEKLLNNDFDRSIHIRRIVMSHTTNGNLHESKLPYDNYNWSLVSGACCENAIGYAPIPVGMAGPLVIDGKRQTIPMATTEGTLLPVPAEAIIPADVVRNVLKTDVDSLVELKILPRTWSDRPWRALSVASSPTQLTSSPPSSWLRDKT
ncbi:hypothetical protein CP533_1434, partial [Ophiocordyceps camponoti-saundersi (nom. inval.)]